jgi:hypothetical protein
VIIKIDCIPAQDSSLHKQGENTDLRKTGLYSGNALDLYSEVLGSNVGRTPDILSETSFGFPQPAKEMQGIDL